MSTSIALLSGKGGSGKTSLALTLGSLLSACEIDTVIIDCDLATNGAAFFFEQKLSKTTTHITSTTAWLCEIQSVSDTSKIEYISINDYLQILPSITESAKPNLDINTFTGKEKELFRRTLENIQREHEIVIFDFQSGYTELMNLVLPCVDICLFVIEPDAVSSSSLRSLYLKIGPIIENKKLYQVFNKASDEEYKVYSKLYTGTLFPNIETIRFDWEIRKAFALNLVPSIDSCGYGYMAQISKIAMIILAEGDTRQRIEKYYRYLELKKIEQRADNIQEELSGIKNSTGVLIPWESNLQHFYREKEKKMNIAIGISISGIVIMLVFMIMMMVDGGAYSDIGTIIFGIVAGVTMLSFVFAVSKGKWGTTYADDIHEKVLETELDVLLEKHKILTSEINTKESQNEA